MMKTQVNMLQVAFAFVFVAVLAGATSIDRTGAIFNMPFSDEFYSATEAAFPEYEAINPELLEGDPNVYPDETLGLAVSFLWEGAGFKNTLGYFVFDDAGSILREEVIFENASGTGPGLQGGGTLDPGDSRYIGEFGPGENVGFWLEADGFRQEDGYRYYSMDGMSADGLFHFAQTTVDNSGTAVSITGVEDIHGLGDEDYNDVVFAVTSVSASEIPVWPLLGAAVALLCCFPGVRTRLVEGCSGV